MPNSVCHVCGPVKHEAPTVFCSPCFFIMVVRSPDPEIEIASDPKNGRSEVTLTWKPVNG